ncbi:hypothetical protein [Chitinilyticum piscinae]|uniref:Antibiotic biosynthesis monooxygenase n=1 Tax=Chitinilyticum piscinae TaxID=2866724 RepID=A0A8J7FHB2_9NEIS|nr:hypothetical protein [Chitinilyticum piscinae]MBE9609190.1 hypothetical protein [Chitinilyticum piscinae]
MYIQTVIFSLHPDVPDEAFLPLAAELHDWLRRQPGFASYALYRGQGEWMDQIFWLSEPEAQEANRRFNASTLAPRLLALVDSHHHGFSGSCTDLSEWLKPPV